MDNVKRTIGILMALLMLLGGIAHFISPGTYNGLIPDFLPKLTINYLTGIVEIVLGIGVFLPGYRKIALFGIFVLMICFLPIHIIDAFKQDPVIGTRMVAYARVLMQFLLIYLPWFAQSKTTELK
ncbi:hypothetical protein AB2B38_003625 [Balneola sp. MJW-20]|uniref:hypothetical protein n=1 Tax=Gracilimonas aurantiaca TaxID=3234185 RepID=UPI003466A1B6